MIVCAALDHVAAAVQHNTLAMQNKRGAKLSALSDEAKHECEAATFLQHCFGLRWKSAQRKFRKQKNLGSTRGSRL
jgi:hypothetical protein